MKKIGFMAALVFASALSLTAQQTASANHGRGDHKENRTMPSAQDMADKETQRETKMLALTPEQVEQAKAINLKYSQQREDAMKEVAISKDRSAMENKMQGIRLAQDNELKTILTPDQQTKLAKAHADRGDEQGENKGKGNWKKHGKGQKTNDTPQGASNN
jgi:periplasmic protein CpxP/Spy